MRAQTKIHDPMWVLPPGCNRWPRPSKDPNDICERHGLLFKTSSWISTRSFCYDCNQPFASIAGYRGHWTRVHQPVDAAQFYADGSECQWCGAVFYDRAGLLRHLRGPTGACLGMLMSCAASLDGEVVAELAELGRKQAMEKRKSGL
eukprot:3048232-Pyramimonas_sp.AAC.1